MNEIHSIISNDGTIHIIINGEHIAISRDHDTYEEIRQYLDKPHIDVNKLHSLLNGEIDINNLCSNLGQISESKVRVDLQNDKVYYNDTEFHDKDFCDRILRIAREGHDISYLVNFLDNLCQNQSYRAIMEAFRFIKNEGMPITLDGCFLAYKGVNSDYYDKYTHTIDNTPDGRRVEVSRESVCDDPNRGCSSGLHAGSYKYARDWAENGNVILVKINPKDIVSVPNHSCEKMRVCGYWCVADVTTQSSPLKGEVYDSCGRRVGIGHFTDMNALDNEFNIDIGRIDEYEGRSYCDNLSDDYDNDYYNDY